MARLRRTTFACLTIAALAIAAHPSAAADMYAGVSPNTPVGTAGSLLRISDADGSAVVVGDPVTPGGISGLAFDSTGRLFGSTRVGNPKITELVEIDPDTGALLANLGQVVDAANQSVGISDLTFQPGTDVLYGIADFNAPCDQCLYTIDTTTAVATLVGDPAIVANGGLAFGPDPNDPNGSLLYLAESFIQPTLAVLDPTDASVLSQVPLLFAPGETFEGQPVGGDEAPLDGLGSRPGDGQLFATGPAGALAVLTVGLDGQVRFLTEDVGAKPTDIAFPPDICPGGDDSLDADGDGVPDFCDVCPGGDDNLDDDGDGVPDACDVCPGGDDALDADGDGVPNACDVCSAGDDSLDDDGDGVPDACDVCPAGDDNADADLDGVADACDQCPAGDDALDADGDGVPDACDACPGGNDVLDADGDGVPDACDVCPAGDDGLDADLDGVPDACDVCPTGDDNADADLDGVADACDPCPLDPDNDADGDGVCGDVDTCPGGDDSIDTDGDGTADFCDVCPLDPENDADGDGICESDDNCPVVANSDQSDLDADGVGDACDADIDGDGVLNETDNCVFDPNSDQSDADGDGIGDACDPVLDDEDFDGVPDSTDACAGTPLGEVVDVDGCAISQLCPCAHPLGGDKWKNHGAYVSCVAHASEDFVEAGLMTEAEKDATVSEAAQSSCGKKQK